MAAILCTNFVINCCCRSDVSRSFYTASSNLEMRVLSTIHWIVPLIPVDKFPDMNQEERKKMQVIRTKRWILRGTLPLVLEIQEKSTYISLYLHYPL